MIVSLALGVVLCVALTAGTGFAQTYSFDTGHGAFTPDTRNQGWWSSVEAGVDANDNYFLGRVGAWSGDTHRAFFTFDLSGLDLSGKEVVGATLELTRFDAVSTTGAGALTAALYDVSTPPALLNFNEGWNPAVFNDLGTGQSYGFLTVPVTSGGVDDGLACSLSSSALADISGAAGGYFSIGAALWNPPDSDGDEGLFLLSYGAGVQRLTISVSPARPTINAAPEPGAVNLLGIGLVGIGGTVTIRRRSRLKPG